MSSVKLEEAFARVDIRPMHELDIPVVEAIERAAYQFPWSEGIFRDCLRVGSRGFARKVMLYLLERAKAAGMSEAFLEVRPSNVAAARLYHSLGFEQVGMRRGYYQATVGREDAAVLRRVLNADLK